MKKLLFSSLLLILFATACKKEDAPAPPSLVNKWNVVSLRFTETDLGTVVYDNNYTGTAADYVEFRTDKKMVSMIDGSGDIVDYELLPDNRVLIDGEIYSIQVLTSTNARLYTKYSWAPDEFYEVTINLKK